MWSRKILKKDAKLNFKSNYLRSVIVCLIMAVIVGSYAYSVAEIETSNETTFNFKGMSNSEIINNLIKGITNDPVNQNDISKTTQATRGVFATLFNNITNSSSFLFGILNSINQFFFQDKVLASIIILFGVLIEFLYWMFIGNILRVGENRFFLESKLYPNTKVNRILYLFKIKKIWNVAVIMLLKTVYTLLWSLTIVGGIIKGYSYRMIPYILAENPDINRKDAFHLSKMMMKGNKWKTFKLDCSFFLWEMLSPFTFGFIGFLYINPYKKATNVELYRVLRKNVLEEKVPLSKNLNDIYLTVLPENYNLDIPEDLIGTYPVHLYTIPESPGRKWITTDYHRDYTLHTLILLFFTYSMIGWVWEVTLELMTSGTFVNRGVLSGPWLPIYGSGGVLTLILLKKWIDKPIVTFSLVIVVAAVIEYFTGWYLEVFKGAKWWDYSGYLLNLHGRICLEGLLVFGLGGCVSIYLLAPIIDDILHKIPLKIQITLCILFISLFSVDLIRSKDNPNQGKGITIKSEKTAENLNMIDN